MVSKVSTENKESRKRLDTEIKYISNSNALSLISNGTKNAETAQSYPAYIYRKYNRNELKR